MRSVEYSGQFRKDVGRAQKRGKDIGTLKSLIALLIDAGPLPARYRDHALAGDWTGVRDAHVEPDWLLLYSLHEGVSAIRFERTGTHADLFDE